MNNEIISQGDILYIDIDDTFGSEQSYKNGRPALVIQNNKGNTYSTTTLIVPLTKKHKKELPTHYLLKKKDYPFLKYDSLVLGEQIRCIDIKSRYIEKKIGKISKDDLDKILMVISKNFN